MTAVYQAERHRIASEKARRHSRKPLSHRAALWAARALPTFRKARRACLLTSGAGMIVAAAWLVAVPLGLLAGGVALVVLDALAGE